MAREAEGSPIYGMPILNVDKAKNVVVIKRSLSPALLGCLIRCLRGSHADGLWRW